jgi:hypothetical protein
VSADAVIDLLSEEGAFNPRLLSFRFPESVFDNVSLMPRAFFGLLAEGRGLSLDSLVNDDWRSDELAMHRYNSLTPEERLEVHTVIGYVLHETTHKVDLLISPFGVQYLGVLIHEYLYLQSYVPRALDWPDLLVALRFLPNLTDPPAELNRDAGLRSLWASLTEVVRRELAWGDLGTLRPARAQIETGWDGSVIGPGDHFGAATMIEPVMVLGAVYSFRLADSTWYLRPATIFEAKALANTMLYILDISGSVDDVALYYRRVYLVAKDDLEPDYLFLLDVLARMHNQSDFESVLATGDSAFVRHILVVASGLGWFALQAPPAIPGRDETPSAGSNPMLRLFVGLKEIMAYFRRDSDHGFVTLADILLDIETKRSFHAFEQTTIDAGLAACRDNMSGLNTLINGIWNPDVRGHFAKIIKIMLPYFTDREDSYVSRLGMPDNGNPRTFVTNETEMEPFFHDHTPDDAYADWLMMRGALLFSHAKPDEAFLARLGQHFQSRYLVVPCRHCRLGFHDHWVSPFGRNAVVRCPVTGETDEIDEQDMTFIAMPEGD